MSQPPFGDPGVCPTIVLFSLSTNQSPIGGSLATTSFRIRRPGTCRGVRLVDFQSLVTAIEEFDSIEEQENQQH
jgi:hypothetical protein